MSKLVILASLTAVLTALSTACSPSAPRIVVDPPMQDLGELSQQWIELTYTVRNEGDAPLIVDKVSTSCDCTEARLDRSEIPAGESALLTVTLDPVEDDLFGDVTRVIYLRSNDPVLPEASVQFRVRILKP